MATFTVDIEQIYYYEVVIEAETREEALKIWDGFIADDFGEPTNALTNWSMI